MIVPRPRLVWMFALVAIPAAAVATFPHGAPAAAVALAMLLVTLGVDVLRGSRRSGIVKVELPRESRLTRGREQDISILFHNPAPYDVQLRVAIPFEEVEPVEATAPSGDSRIAWSVTAPDRGDFALGECLCETESPWGLWDVRWAQPLDASLRVYPNLAAEYRRMAALTTRAHGAHARPMLGRGREFEKLREYVPGDGMDEIHWKATARRAAPITKVFQIERSQDIYVVLDASRLSARRCGPDTVLEQYISASLILGAAAERQGDRFGLLTFDDQVQRFVGASAGREHFGACRDAVVSLASRLVSPDYQEIVTFLRLRVRRRAFVVFLTELDDPVLAESFLSAVPLIARQHLVRVLMLRPAAAAPLFERSAADAPDLYRRLSGHLEWRKLRETAKVLRHKGVDFVMAEPGELALALTRTYLAAKRGQRL